MTIILSGFSHIPILCMWLKPMITNSFPPSLESDGNKSDHTSMLKSDGNNSDHTSTLKSDGNDVIILPQCPIEFQKVKECDATIDDSSNLLTT